MQPGPGAPGWAQEGGQAFEGGIHSLEFLKAHVLRIVGLHNGCIALTDLHSAWLGLCGFNLELDRFGIHQLDQLLDLLRPYVTLARYSGNDYLRTDPRAANGNGHPAAAQARVPPPAGQLPQPPPVLPVLYQQPQPAAHMQMAPAPGAWPPPPAPSGAQPHVQAPAAVAYVAQYPSSSPVAAGATARTSAAAQSMQQPPQVPAQPRPPPALKRKKQQQEGQARATSASNGTTVSLLVTPEERCAAAIPAIVSGIQQLKDAFASSTTYWSAKHVCVLRRALAAHFDTDVQADIKDSGTQSLLYLREVMNFMAGTPVPPGHALALPADGLEDTPETPKRPAAPRVSKERLHAAVLELIESEGCGVSWAAIAGLESAVLRRFGATSWAEISDSSSSLLQLLMTDERLSEALGGGHDGGARAALEKVLQVAAQALLCCSSSGDEGERAEEEAQSAKQAAVAACLCAAFQVQQVEQLGHGPVRRILQLCSEQQVTARRSPMTLHALACEAPPAAQQGSGAAGMVDRTAAIECLMAAPDLADLHQWSRWNQVFAPCLGPLEAFLSSEGERHGLMTVEVPGTGAGSGPRQLKLRSSTSMQEFVECCTRGNARGVVCIALSLAVQSGGVGRAPLALLGTHMEACLKAMALEGTARQGDEGPVSTPSAATAVSATGMGYTAAFALRCLALLPEAIAASLAPQLVLQPLAQVLGGPAAAHAALLQAAQGAVDEEGCKRSVLHALGWSLGITAWQEDWRKARMAPTAARQQPQHEPLASGSALTTGPGAAAAAQGSGAAVPSGGQDLLLDQVLSSLATGGGSASAAAVSMECSTMPAPAASSGPVAGVKVEEVPADTDPCRALIESIRLEEFGVGMSQLTGQAADLAGRQSARVGRALTRLSRELYSMDTHFVLELVQNADDNKYPSTSGLPPTLEFVLQPGSITVLNNEAGFSASDVRALCDVGLSTKTKAGGGYIGQKGIGFKSVFKVTDAPQVHSNGFHVKFDLVADASLGYVLPTWVKDRGTADTAAQASRIGLTSAPTRIVLPLKRAVLESDGGLSLRQRFGDVHPTLLLFLQKLSVIAITDAVDAARSTVMVRRQLEHGLVELRHGPAAEQAARWLVVDCNVKPSLARLGEQLASTRVALGFCLEGATPCQQQVFAFLPLRSYGLRFVVQGDFVVPSSREALDSDSAWNQMLRSEIPSLFARALESFMRLPATSEGGRWGWVDRWLRSIPLDGEAQGFFSALPHSIAALLRAMPCIPADDNTLVAPGDALFCGTPSIRQLVSGQQLQSLLGKRFVHPDVEILASSSQLRALLGVREFSPLDTLDLMKAMIEGEGGAAVLQARGVRWVQQLLLAVFEMLDSGSSSSSGSSGSSGSSSHLSAQRRAQVLQQLRALQLLPLQGGGWASVAAASAMDTTAGDNDISGSADSPPIFFPVPESRQAAPSPLPAQLASGSAGAPAAPQAAVSAQPARGSNSLLAATDRTVRTLSRASFDAAWLQAGPHALRFVSPVLLAGLEPDDMARLVRGLQSLGVKELSAVDVAQLHVLPAMAEPAALMWPLQRLVSSLALFVVAGLLQPGCELGEGTEEQEMLQALKTAAVIALADGSRCRPGADATQLVLLPEALGGAANWQKEFPGCQWRVLADAYLTQPPAVLPAWKWLLEQLGLLRLPAVVADERTIKLKEGCLPGRWHSLPSGTLGGPPHGKWMVANSMCSCLERLADHLVALKEQGPDGAVQAAAGVERLLKLLDGHWDTFGPALSAICTAIPPKASASDAAAEEEAAAGPVTAGAPEQSTAIPSSFAMSLRALQLPTATGQLFQPSSLFLQTEPTRALLGDDAPFLKPGLARQELAAALGVICEPHAASVLDVLIGWSAATGNSHKKRLRTMKCSPRRMAGIYRFLSQACEQDAAVLERVRSAFAQEQRLVWLPLRSQDGQQQQQALDESCETSVQGRFMALRELYLHDPSGVLERLPEKAAPMRAVLATYPSLGLFFGEYLGCRSAPGSSSGAGDDPDGVRKCPSVEDYTMAVQAVAQRPVDNRDVNTWGDVLPVLMVWARQLATGQLTEEQLKAAAAELFDAHMLLAFNGGHWVSLGQQPYLCDDAPLEQLLAGQAGVHLLVLPDDASLQGMTKPSPFQQQEQGHQGGQAGAGGDDADGSPGAQLAALLSVMGVKALSAAVEREVRASGTTAYSDAYLAIADAVPYIQRFLVEYWSWAQYSAREEDITTKLAAFTCQSVARLEVVFTLPVSCGPAAKSDPMPRIAVLMGTKLLLAAGANDPYEEAAKELSRLFNDGVEDSQIADAIFMLLMGIASGTDLEAVIQRTGVPPAPEDSLLGMVQWELDRESFGTLLAIQDMQAATAATSTSAAAAAAEAGVNAEGDASMAMVVYREGQAGPSSVVGQKRARGGDDGAGPSEALADDADGGGAEDQRPAKRQRGEAAAGGSGNGNAAAPAQPQQGQGQGQPAFVMGAVGGANVRQGAWAGGSAMQLRSGAGGAFRSGGLQRQQLHMQAAWQKRAVHQLPVEGRGDAAPVSNAELAQRVLARASYKTRHNFKAALEDGRVTVAWVPAALLQEAWPVLAAAPGGGWANVAQQNAQVGRWGEQVAYLWLKELFKGKAKVVWENEGTETGKPFDVTITPLPLPNRTLFVEVKATLHSYKMEFELSRREMAFAQQKGAAYSVLRVIGAVGVGQGDVCVMYLKDPMSLYNDKAISFVTVI